IDNSSKTAFYLYNVHLDHRSQRSREKSIQLLTERIHNRTHPDPVVITGDFNAGEENTAIMYLKGKGALRLDDAQVSKTPVVFVDSFRQLHADADAVGTSNRFKGIRSGDKIDYVFVQPDAQVLEAEIIHDSTKGKYPSDHFPVIAKIRLAE
ncbi:unnamed protein product, partial [marine sediment metagenome]